MRKIEQPAESHYWAEESSDFIATASFFTLEPVGEVCDESSNGLYAVVDVEVACAWQITAYFPLKPGCCVVDFWFDDKQLALQALLDWKGPRPIFYCDASNSFELTGSTVAELLDQLRSADVNVDREAPRGNWFTRRLKFQLKKAPPCSLRATEDDFDEEFGKKPVLQ